MADAARDKNRVTTLIAASSADVTTPVRLYVDPVKHTLIVKTNAIPITVKSIAPRDANRIPTILGVSKNDGLTPVVICADPSDHALFVEPTP